MALGGKSSLGVYFANRLRGRSGAPRLPLLRSSAARDVSLSELYHGFGRRCPRRAYEAPWFSLVLAGSYSEQIGPKTLEYRAPCVAFYPPDREHRSEVGRRGVRVLVVTLGTVWERWLPSVEQPGALLHADALRAAYRMHHELKAVGPLCSAAIDGLAHDLLEALAGSAERGERRRPGWLDRVVERLHAEYARPVSLAALAIAESVHPTHLSRTFRRFEGISPSAYLQLLRCRHILGRLAEVDAPSLAELSAEAGFADQAHCTRVMKRVLGATPGRLRRQLGLPETVEWKAESVLDTLPPL